MTIYRSRTRNLSLAACAALFCLLCPPGSPAQVSGPGAWPIRGAIYEVSQEYFPHHSFTELSDQMGRLEKLGASVIYIPPVFKCLGNAQHLIVDHMALNPRYGSEADLKQLVQNAHRHHVKCLWIW